MAFFYETRTQKIVKLEENCGGGRGRVGRGPGHPSRSRSPDARCERGAQGIVVRVVEVLSQRSTSVAINPFTATGDFDIPPPRWPTFLVTLFPILKEGMGLSLLDEFEVQYHVIKK